jgi:hypothetical protein
MLPKLEPFLWQMGKLRRKWLLGKNIQKCGLYYFNSSGKSYKKASGSGEKFYTQIKYLKKIRPEKNIDQNTSAQCACWIGGSWRYFFD